MGEHVRIDAYVHKLILGEPESCPGLIFGLAYVLERIRYFVDQVLEVSYRDLASSSMNTTLSPGFRPSVLRTLPGMVIWFWLDNLLDAASKVITTC